MRPATVRYYFDADILGLGKVVAGLRPDATYPGDPGAVVRKRQRSPCAIASTDVDDVDWNYHDHRILVSEHLNLSEQGSSAQIRSLVGERIRKPLRRYRLPAPDHIDWHTKNLFKHPAR